MDKKILIIEDEEIIAQMIQDNMEARGYKVVVAYNGIEGLRKAEAYSPDLIALDIMMSGLDGINVLRRLKKNKKTKDIPVIILSIAESYREKGLEMGAAAFVKKPFDFSALDEKIRSFSDEKKVMVVDDNKDTLKLIKTRLNTMGYEVVCVTDEKSLFDRLGDEKPDVILMDIVLPGKDGLEIIRKLKGSREYSGIPIIAFSGYVSDEVFESEIAGVDEYISGKFNEDTLAELVRKYIG